MNINENGIYYYNCDDTVFEVKVKKIYENGDLQCEFLTVGELLIIKEFHNHLFDNKTDALLDLKKTLEESKQEIERRIASIEEHIQGGKLIMTEEDYYDEIVAKMYDLKSKLKKGDTIYYLDTDVNVVKKFSYVDMKIGKDIEFEGEYYPFGYMVVQGHYGNICFFKNFDIYYSFLTEKEAYQSFLKLLHERKQTYNREIDKQISTIESKLTGNKEQIK